MKYRGIYGGYGWGGYRKTVPGHALQAAQNGIVSMFGKHGYSVVFEADACPCVNFKSKTVTLPVFPEDVDYDMLSLLRGYTDHELGHVIFTDQDVEADMRTFLGDLINSIEDGRIERELAKKYRGCKYNLEFTRTLHEKELLAKVSMAGDDNAKEIINASVAMQRLAYGDSAKSAARGLTGDAKDIVLNHADELGRVDSTKDVVSIAEVLYEELKNYIEEGDKRQQEEGDQKGKCEVDSKECEECGCQDEQEPEQMPGEQEPEQMHVDIEQIAKRAKEMAEDYDKWIKTKLVSSSGEHREGYAAYKDNDKVKIVPNTYRGNIDDIVEKLDTNIGATQNKLLAILQTERPTMSRYQKKGIVDDRRIGLVAFEENKLFLRRRRRIGLDSTFTILIDLSGSMRGEKIEMAMQMAIFFTRTLEVMHIPCEVLGFTTRGFRTLGLQSYTRSIPLRHYIFKKFDERFGYVSSRFGYFLDDHGLENMCHNVDGEAIAWATSRILKRKESNKYLLVLSDGHPDGGEADAEQEAYLIKAIEAATLMGVCCVGLGIYSSSVADYYDDNIVMSATNKSIVAEFMEKFKSIVIKAKNEAD